MADAEMTMSSLTHYRQTVAPLISQLQSAAVDFEAFERSLPLCQLSQCRATCCHDGAVLSQEEADFIGEGVITLPDGRLKTQTVPSEPAQRAENFPVHFPQTRCIFLDDEHRCSWQLKSVEEERHPWFYKPVSCWMHPVLLKMVDGRPLLTIVAPEHDKKGFASCTPCGALGTSSPSGTGQSPARETLKGELEMLSQLSGRDFLGELNAPSF